MLSVLQDLRYGARRLLENPGFTLIAVLTLALGIGANTALFSVLNTYLFRALPFPSSGQLVQIYRTSAYSQSWPHSAANFFDYRAQNSVFEHMAAISWTNPSLVMEGESPERLQGMAVTADFFPVLGMPAAVGRVFTAEEDQPGPNQVVVLGDRFWKRRLGGDPNVVGRLLRLNGESVKIIGVMPPNFEQPLLFGNVDVWRPIAFSAERRQNRDNNYLSVIARLKTGLTLEQAQEAMVILFASVARANSGNQAESLRLQPLQRSMSTEIGRNVMWFSFGLAGFLLLIACANLANLQLVRTAARTREHAIRAALGAGRLRLLRQSLIESLLMSFLGGGLSLLLAWGSVEFISLRLFREMPGARLTLDFMVLGFALLCSVVTGLLFGTVPAWLASRADLNQALKHNLRGSGSGLQPRLRNALVIGEVAFALILLAGAGLFLRGLERFISLDPGWRVDGLLTAQTGMPQRAAFYQQLEERLRALPGVKQVALSSSQPFWGFGSSGPARAEGQPEPPPGQWPEVFFETVSTQYFETLGVRLLHGRAFNSADTADKAPVIIINETLARRFWPHEDAIGKRIIGHGDTSWTEIVGVVNDMRFPATLSEPYTRFEAFLPLAQSSLRRVNIFVRSATPPEWFAATLRRTVMELDPALPVYQIRTARSLVEQGLGNITLLGTLLGAFAALGLVLAAIGIYGVISYSVTQRTNEIGIRMAMGAQTCDVLWLALGKGAGLILIGAVLGVGGAYAVARLLIAAIPTLPTRDPLTLAGVTLVLVTVAIVACYLPARKAAKVDPTVALRFE